MPKQHYITCLAQCVPTLHPPSGFVSTPPSFYCRTLVGSLPLANNCQHSASRLRNVVYNIYGRTERDPGSGYDAVTSHE